MFSFLWVEMKFMEAVDSNETHNYGSSYNHTIRNAQTECCSRAGISHTAHITHMELSRCTLKASCHFHFCFIVLWLQKYKTPNIFCGYPVLNVPWNHVPSYALYYWY
jgi:hypothetical protein